MKKFFLLFVLIFVTATISAEGITGIFGIEFRKTSAEVKTAMKEKEWILSDTDGTTLTFKKNSGTYANLPVDKINFYFFEDKLYNIEICFAYNIKPEELVNALEIVVDTYSLTFVTDNEQQNNGVLESRYGFIDPNLNFFVVYVVECESISAVFFNLIDSRLSAENRNAEEQMKQEETTQKNKDISSDL